MRICTLPALALLVLLVVPAAVAGTDPNPVFPLFAGLGVGGGAAQAADSEDYARAEQFLPQSVVPEALQRHGRPPLDRRQPVVLVRARGPGWDCVRACGPLEPDATTGLRPRPPCRSARECDRGDGRRLCAAARYRRPSRQRHGPVRRVQPDVGMGRRCPPRPEPGRRSCRRRPRLARRPPRSLPRRRQPLPPRSGDRLRPDPHYERDDGLLLRQDRGRLGRAGDRRTRERHGDSLCGLVAGLSEGPHLPGGPARRDAPVPAPVLARERHASADLLYLPLLDARGERGAVRTGRDRCRERHCRQDRPRPLAPYLDDGRGRVRARLVER